jgi:choline dehydrogenase
MKTGHDYIIIGAGSAGCVLANRLTEDPDVRVLLLEAGGKDTKQEIAIPAAFSKLFKSTCDWAYWTTEQIRLNHRALYWPRGKVLGGSSSLNAMIYSRGHHHDYDAWRDMGNAGWGFSDVLPFFKKAEHQQRGSSIWHGSNGPLHVSDLRTVNPLSQAFVEAGTEQGLSQNVDFNGEEKEGIGIFQVTQRRGKRCSTASAYLKPARSRANLVVLTEAQVTRLLLDRQRVIGVEYIQGNQPTQVRAEREVLLCAGAINSPQVLLLSGIGPANHLKALDIPVIIDLPGVGENLQDHLLAVVGHACTRPITLASAERIGHILEFLLFQKGPLTSCIGEAGAFIKTHPDQPAPDLELLFAPAYFFEHSFANPPGHGFTIGCTHLHPRSRGTIRLRSARPFEAPLIDPHYFEDEEDVAAMLTGLRLIRRIAQARALAPFRGEEIWPGQAVQSEQQLRAYLRERVETLYHPVGTCKMGNDPLAVVDAELRVHGLTGLRVIDASIMPSIISGHPNAPTIMIAEKAATLIKQTVGKHLSKNEAAPVVPGAVGDH